MNKRLLMVRLDDESQHFVAAVFEVESQSESATLGKIIHVKEGFASKADCEAWFDSGAWEMQ